MRILSFILLFLAFQNHVFSQGKVNWMTWEEAVEANKKVPKKIFVDVYTNWCGWCKKMDQSTFTNPVVAKHLNENFYPIKFNAETKEEITLGDKVFRSSSPENPKSTHELAIEILQGKLSYPTVVMLDESFNSLGPIPGYQSPKDLEPMLIFIGKDLYKNQKWGDYMQQFKGEVE
jgi:thioredoxin-related protein